jgi:chromosome partitioning protein
MNLHTALPAQPDPHSEATLEEQKFAAGATFGIRWWPTPRWVAVFAFRLEAPPEEVTTNGRKPADFAPGAKSALGIELMRTLAFANQKGGVGKTTTAYHVAVALAEQGQRVLAVDLDPQAHLTLMSGIDISELQVSVYDVLVNDRPVTDVIQAGRFGYDILPSDQVLARAEAQLPGMYSKERRLRKALAAVAPRYDFCLLDCPPSIGVLTQNALVAADGVVVPVQPELYAIKGMELLFETMKEVAEDNPGLTVIAVVPTQRRRNKHHDQMVEVIREQIGHKYPDLSVAAGIPEVVAFGRAARAGQPIFEFAPTSPGADAYRLLTENILAGV